MMCSNSEDLYEMANWAGKGTESRQRLIEKLQGTLLACIYIILACLYEVQGELLQSPRSSESTSAFPSHCDKVLFPSFPKVHISTASHQKAFIFGP